jgi:hypothetical protein
MAWGREGEGGGGGRGREGALHQQLLIIKLPGLPVFRKQGNIHIFNS